jgi:pteridine reductase
MNGQFESMISSEGATKVALLTGGAKRIGAVIARCLHAAGFDLALHYRSSSAEAEVLASELNAVRPESVRLYQADLTDTAKLKQIVDQAAKDFGRLDALINNASSFYPTPLAEITLDHWADLFATNAQAPLFLSQAAAPYLQQSEGAIINIVDIYADRPLVKYAPYCMAKAALVNMTYALARELGPNVRVNGVAPGNIMWSTNMEKAETPVIVTERTALKRQGEPMDIARTIRFLLTDAPYITGQIIRVDGGRWLFI